jgi:cell shape-determining protein MreC
MKGRLVLLTLTALLVALFLARPSSFMLLQQRFRQSKVPPADEVQLLSAENAVLKARLAVLEKLEKQLPERATRYRRALVMSRYPFSSKREFLVNVGARHGVFEKAAVIASLTALPRIEREPLPQGALVGAVEKVFEDTSVVTTVLDRGFRSAVKVGPSGVDALFEGGLEPMLSLLPKNAGISAGDIAYSTDPSYPYGLAVGEIRELFPSPEGAFQEARLLVPFELNSTYEVFVVFDPSRVAAEERSTLP